MQLALFGDGLEQHDRLEREESQREDWRICWGWSGPVAGEYAEIGSIGVSMAIDSAEHNSIYGYCQRVKLIHELPGGRWLCRIEDHEDLGDNGTLVVLGIIDIWPPTDDLTGN